MPVHTRDRLAFFAASAVTTLRDAFRCGVLQVVAPPSRRLEPSSRGTTGSKPFHPLRWSAYRPDWSMLVNMRAHSPRPPPIPECSSAVATTLPTPPPAFTLVYSNVVRRQSMAVTTVVGNLDGGTLAAAISARERNHSRAISRNHAPAAICIEVRLATG
jgi:hypothetical protein